MSKNAIVVTNIDFDHVYKFTKPYFELYSEKVGAELIIINQNTINIKNENYQNLRFENFQVYNYFDKFDRILLLDCDTLVKPSCPDYFLLDEDFIYVTRVDNYIPHQERCYLKMQQVQKKLGKVEGWNQFYFNSGVMLLSRKHKSLFKLDIEKMTKVEGKTRVQDYLNWAVQSKGLPIIDLGPKFNFFKPNKVVNNIKRQDANILHFTGPKNIGGKNIKLIERDSLSFKEKVLY